MSLKLIGALLLVIGCGGVGFQLAAAHVREERMLRKLLAVLNYMSCELQYRLSPLPELCRQASQQASGTLGAVFLRLASEIDNQMAPDAARCMNHVLSGMPGLPERARRVLQSLGSTLGRFDLDGQLHGIAAVEEACRRNLSELEAGRDSRLREYKTLGLCAGAALAILLM